MTLFTLWRKCKMKAFIDILNVFSKYIFSFFAIYCEFVTKLWTIYMRCTQYITGYWKTWGSPIGTPIEVTNGVAQKRQLKPFSINVGPSNFARAYKRSREFKRCFYCTVPADDVMKMWHFWKPNIPLEWDHESLSKYESAQENRQQRVSVNNKLTINSAHEIK